MFFFWYFLQITYAKFLEISDTLALCARGPTNDDEMQMVGTWLRERASMNAFEILLLCTRERESDHCLRKRPNFAHMLTLTKILTIYLLLSYRIKR